MREVFHTVKDDNAIPDDYLANVLCIEATHFVKALGGVERWRYELLSEGLFLVRGVNFSPDRTRRNEHYLVIKCNHK